MLVLIIASWPAVVGNSKVRMTMRRFLAAALLSSVPFLGTETQAVRAAECYPHCDYNHYYGPSDFSYISPGLYGYPVCGLRGECSPYLIYSKTGPRRGKVVIVRFPRLIANRPAQ
jgi:hypothetical protein